MRFDVIAVSATRRWTENGKRRQETRRFWQTLNPFNVNAAGLRKSREEIYAEITAERDAWLRAPKEAS